MSDTQPSDNPSVRFQDLALSEPVMRALADVGYESPSPIQSATIPYLLQGRDLVGTAQTGTGKTAAFALPILSRIDVNIATTQALVLAPTRELAIQVAEAFQKYAAHIRGFHVLPIYGGQSYGPQLHALKRGVQQLSLQKLHICSGKSGNEYENKASRQRLQMGFYYIFHCIILLLPAPAAGRQFAPFFLFLFISSRLAPERQNGNGVDLELIRHRTKKLRWEYYVT